MTALTLREEIRIPMDQLAAHRRPRQLPQRIPLVALTRVDRNLADLIHRHHTRPSQALDDDLTADALLDLLLDLLQNLARQHHHRRRAVAHLGVLRARDVHQDARRRVHDVEQLHHRRAVVGDGLLAILVHQQQVPAVGPECALDGRLHGDACVDVRCDLPFALRLVGAWSPPLVCCADPRSFAPAYLPSFKTTMVGVWPPKDMVARSQMCRQVLASLRFIGE